MYFDGFIRMGLLSQAYGLYVQECIDLAQRLSCNFGILTKNYGYDLTKIDDYAKAYADMLIKESGQKVAHEEYARAMFLWHGDNTHQYDLWNKCKFFWDHGELEKTHDELWPIMRLRFVDNLRVNKAQVVYFFVDHNEDPCPKREVKGLTRAIVKAILARRPAAPASPPDSPPAAMTETTQKVEPVGDDVQASLTDPQQVKQAIEKAMKKTTSLTAADKRHLTALLYRLDGKTYKEAYCKAYRNTKTKDGNILSAQGKKYCEFAHTVAVEKLGVQFDINLLTGLAD